MWKCRFSIVFLSEICLMEEEGEGKGRRGGRKEEEEEEEERSGEAIRQLQRKALVKFIPL